MGRDLGDAMMVPSDLHTGSTADDAPVPSVLPETRKLLDHVPLTYHHGEQDPRLFEREGNDDGFTHGGGATSSPVAAPRTSPGRSFNIRRAPELPTHVRYSSAFRNEMTPVTSPHSLEPRSVSPGNGNLVPKSEPQLCRTKEDGRLSNSNRENAADRLEEYALRAKLAITNGYAREDDELFRLNYAPSIMAEKVLQHRRCPPRRVSTHRRGR